MLRATNRPILAYFEAIKNLRLRQVSLILKTGYDPNLLINGRGQNGLQYMINLFGATDAHFRLQAPINKSTYLSIARLLLDSGLDPNSADLLTGETAIFDAIRFHDKEMVALLLNYVDFSVRNKNGETALMCAARFGNKQVMRLILEHLRHLEMDAYFLRQRNRFGMTTLELARAENLECAKVLAKHLIAYGHHAGAALARSSSHHQLLAPRIPHHRAAAMARAARQPPLLVDDLDSDYESDLFGTPAFVPARGLASRAPAAGFYDPKAAEFNQYLLEQQELAAAEAAEGGAISAGNSDDEQDAGGYFGAAGGSGGMIRSRSCILATGRSGTKQPQQQQQQQQGAKYAPSSSKKAIEPKQGASWDSSGGRSTIN